MAHSPIPNLPVLLGGRTQRTQHPHTAVSAERPLDAELLSDLAPVIGCPYAHKAPNAAARLAEARPAARIRLRRHLHRLRLHAANPQRNKVGKAAYTHVLQTPTQRLLELSHY